MCFLHLKAGGEYENLYALTLSGDINIPSDFSFKNAEVYNTSGNTKYFANGNLK